jgi:hypothetical protein
MTQDGYFYGREGTPFADAAEAWFWTVDCLEARASGSKGCSGLRVGRPCEPDDIVIALRRLDLPPAHARTLTAWGNRREVPPAGTDARRLWDQVMAKLAPVLRAKGIVRLNLVDADRALIDAVTRVGEDMRSAEPVRPFKPDFQVIAGTGGSRARIAARAAQVAVA